MENIYPVLPIKDIVIFPHVVVPLFVGREKSIRALAAAMKSDKKIIFLTQKDMKDEEPSFDRLYHDGVLGNVIQLLNLPDGTVKALIEGTERVTALNCVEENGFMSVYYEFIEKSNSNNVEVEAYCRTVQEQFENYAKLNKRVSLDVINAIKTLNDPDDIIDVVAAHLTLKIEDKQDLLAEKDTLKRFEKLLNFLESEIDVIHVEKKIRNRVKKQMEKSQKEYYLNEQIKAIQKELGDIVWINIL